MKYLIHRYNNYIKKKRLIESDDRLKPLCLKLLEILNSDGLFYGKGLCSVIDDDDYQFSDVDRKLLKKFVRYNRPINIRYIFIKMGKVEYKNQSTAYYWKCGDVKSRIKWLEYRINKL
jgi:hypothetical protein